MKYKKKMKTKNSLTSSQQTCRGCTLRKKNSQNTFPYIHNNFIVFNVEENRKNGF